MFKTLFLYKKMSKDNIFIDKKMRYNG